MCECKYRRTCVLMLSVSDLVSRNIKKTSAIIVCMSDEIVGEQVRESVHVLGCVRDREGGERGI